MIRFWKLQFWASIVTDLREHGVWFAALLVSGISSFLHNAWIGAASALEPNPALLALALIAVTIDTGAGIYKAFIGEDDVLSGDRFGQIIDKLVKYGVLILIFSAIAGAGEEAGLPNVAYTWMRDFGYMVVIVRDGISAVENVWDAPIGALIKGWRGTMSDASDLGGNE